MKMQVTKTIARELTKEFKNDGVKFEYKEMELLGGFGTLPECYDKTDFIKWAKSGHPIHKIIIVRFEDKHEILHTFIRTKDIKQLLEESGKNYNRFLRGIKEYIEE